MSEFRLPDVGEGLTEAEIVTWRVEVGDEVKVNDPIVDIETAKSIVELPSPFAGVVEELLVAEGDTVAVGTVIVRIGEGQASGDLDTPSRKLAGTRSPGTGGRVADERSEARIETTAESPQPESAETRPKVLVGYGPSERRRRTRSARTEIRPSTSVRVLAKPPVRKLAKDLGIDLTQVPSTGDVVTRAEVEAFARSHETASTATPVSGVRRATAEAMVASVAVPQATEWVTVDVSATVELVAQLKQDRRFADVKVTPTLIAARAVCLALGRTPDLHAQWRGATIEHPPSVGLGIAAATERGLVVPVVREAETLSLADLGRAIDELVATAREGRVQPAQLSGGTFTITNVGVFGVDGGTPILPPGQSGILALGQVARRPWVVDDGVVPRWVTTLAVTFDHRVADGEQASRFLADVATLMGNPAMALAF
ncbi:dihydrolipoamide acetyltransferase family protein [Aeromicrobium sp. 179-A 4D2 NHS]|uniref:dihydrolipoamide acetyltransferase family protein n=1 Tax=Aeromicrobium sp. 179-A 4D2 NHS TaxID=3142375 RepID=UPI0039A0C094